MGRDVGYLLQVATATNSTTTGNLPSAAAPILTVAELAVALAGILLVGTLLTRLMTTVAGRSGASKSFVSTIRQGIAVLMILAGVAAVASLTGLSSSLTTLTLSGIAGLAASLALQNTLSNVIAGVFLLQDGVLRLGDDLEFGAVRGEVVKLNLRTTWLKTKEGVIVVVGNSNLAAGPIVNRTALARLQKKLQV
ncbi:MAG TPA: mechanosensitive ion channel domain-containing protein [Nitrososphaerales archaeon]|nr:mechanosensitive ion channel domain-containing protein [Nitrososphaerales archaeon]